MAKREIERTVQQSVLDRLIDLDPRSGGDTPISLGESLKRFKDALRRDLEALLNSRRAPLDIAERYVETKTSVLMFGLPDVSSIERSSRIARERLRKNVQEAIAAFEPRLTDVRVTILEGADDPKQQLRFVIEGMMRVDPAPEQVVFDTLLELSSGDYHVSEEIPGA
jgi:type VI secretion system protein ImpF